MDTLQNISLWWSCRRAKRFHEQGSACLCRNDSLNAARLCSQAIQQNPKLTEAYNTRGRARYRLGDYDGAIADYSAVLASEKDAAEVYLNRAMAYHAKCEINEALGDLNLAIYLDAHLALAFNLRGMMDEMQGNLNGAIADYTQAIRLNPAIDLAYTNRGSARAHEGDLHGAIADYQIYLELGGGKRNGDQSSVESEIATLQGQLKQHSAPET